MTCWGNNAQGELGTRTNTPFTAVPQRVLNVPSTIDLAATHRHACAVTPSGSLWCWGTNTSSQLGVAQSGIEAPVQVNIGLTEQIATGWTFTCARTQGLLVSCWGNNAFGQLGSASAMQTEVPQPVSTLSNVLMLSARGEHVCAIVQSGRVKCWGRSTFGEVGNGTRAEFVAVPQQVQGLERVVQVSVGDSFVCALQREGSVVCWGDNTHNQTGSGLADHVVLQPTPVQGLRNVMSISSGLGHSCAVQRDLTVWCWGTDGHGQLGQRTPDGTSAIPLQVPGLNNVVEAVAGGEHTCARTLNNEVWCWGNNDHGQLGVPMIAEWPTPVRVQGL